MPPIACQTFCPSRTSPSPIKTRPSEVTTYEGIGGAWRKISVPIQPSTANDMTKIAIKIIQSLFISLFLKYLF
jgi:hypothetical protein